MSRKGLIFFAALSVLWGIPYLMIKVAVDEVSVAFLVFARSVIGAVVLLPWAIAAGEFGRLTSRWLPVVAFCLVEMVIPWGLIAHAESRTESSTAGLLIALTPAFTVVVAAIVGGEERVSRRRWFGMLIGFTGVAALAFPIERTNAVAILELLLAALSYAIGSVVASRWFGEIHAATATAACLILATAVYSGPAITQWPSEIPSGAALASLVGLGVFCTAVAFAVFFLLVREVGPERAVVITYVAPAVAVLAGVLVLSEPLDWRIGGALALILYGSHFAMSQPGSASRDKLQVEASGIRRKEPFL